MKGTLPIILVSISLVTASGCTSEDILGEHCTASGLQEALSSASAGDIVRIGVCHVEGSFTVPDGVSLVGAGAGQSVIASDERAAVMVIGDIGMPRVADLSIVSGGTVGLVVAGEGGGGSAEIEGVEIEVTQGVGLAAEQLGSLSLSNVVIDGPITADIVDSLPADPVPTTTGTHGLILVGVEEAELDGVVSSGFALFGAMMVDSSVTWRGGGAPGNHGTGLLVEGGIANFEGLDLCGTLKGELRGFNVYAAVFSSGVSVESSDLEVCDTQGFGVLHHSSTGVHIDLNAHGNNSAALWAQASTIELSGAGSSIMDNRFAGVVLYETDEATIANAEIGATEAVTQIIGETGSIQAGDGVQVVNPRGNVVMQDLTLMNNERVGILLELNEAPESLVLDGVDIEGIDAQNGAIAQGPGVPPDWDANITRGGATLLNDEGFEGTMPVVRGFDEVDIPVGVTCVIGDIGGCLMAW